MEILNITRSHIQMQIGDRTVTVHGEAYLPGYGSPDFVVYSDSIRKWDAPNDHVAIDEMTKREILELLKSQMQKRKMTIEIE